MKSKRAIQILVAVIWVSLTAFPLLPGQLLGARADIPAGYSEFYIPGSEEQMWGIFYDLDPYLLDINDGMHSIIAVTAGADNTSLYYDHWEDDYDFDPGNLTSADESYFLDQGDVQKFESSAIPVNPRGTTNYYDGRDRLYVIGGAVNVSRAIWTESAGTLFAQAWEVLPIKPYSHPIPHPGWRKFSHCSIQLHRLHQGLSDRPIHCGWQLNPDRRPPDTAIPGYGCHIR